MARIVVVGSARAHIFSLPPLLQEAVFDALPVVSGDPEAGRRLRGRFRGLWSLRVGAYRILYDVVDRGKTVRVLAVRHRAVAYRRRPR